MGGTGTLLLAAVGGYWVLERASKQKGNLQRIGQVVGGLVILSSLIGVACRVWYVATCPPGDSGTKWFCPFTSKTSSKSAPISPSK